MIMPQRKGAKIGLCRGKSDVPVFSEMYKWTTVVVFCNIGLDSVKNIT
jgi:hypothetical protein